MSSIIVIIQLLFKILSSIIILDAILSFVLPPFNPVRSFLDKLVEPLLNPIRKILPSMAGFDLSPIVAILILQVIEFLLVQLLR